MSLNMPSQDLLAAKRIGLQVGRGFWALVDQGVTSLGNFLTIIILAHALPAREYGAYAVVFGVLVFCNNLQNALIIYPLSIKVARGEDTLSALLGTSLFLCTILAFPLGASVAVTMIIVGKAKAIAAGLAAMLLWQFQETTRRALLAQLRHSHAVWGDAIGYLGQAGILFVYARIISSAHSSLNQHISLEAVFTIMALTSALGAGLQAWQAGVHSPGSAGLLKHARYCWDQGRWLLFTNVLYLFTINAFPWTLGAAFGLKEVAKYDATGNLLRITNPISTGIAGLIVPAAAKANRVDGITAAFRSAASFGMQGGVLLLPYFIVLLIVPSKCLAFFYGNSSIYAQEGTLIRLYVVAYALTYLVNVLVALLNAMELNRSVFWSQMINVGLAICVGLPLAISGASFGAVAGTVCIVLARAAVMLWILWKIRPVHASPSTHAVTSMAPAL